MDRTLGEWGRKGIEHWVNGVGEAHKNKTDQTPQYKKTKQTTPDGVGEKKNAQRWADK